MTLRTRLQHIAARRPLTDSKRGAAIRALAKELGLVYFGSIDQHVDEFEIIRGLSVSNTHKDSHFAVGNFDGFDISVVDRLQVSHGGTRHRAERFVVLQVALEDKASVPPTLLRATGTEHLSSLTVLPPSMRDVTSHFSGLSSEFVTRYQLFSSPSQLSTLEQIFTDEVERTIAARFWPLSVEVSNDTLLVYITDKKITHSLLRGALSLALWLSQQVPDKQE